MKRKRMIAQGILIAVLLVIGCLVCFPFFWMILSSFKTNLEIGSTIPTFFPENPTLDNFNELFADMNFSKYLGNTLIVTLYSMLSVLFNSMAGYAFAKFRFRGQRFLFIMVLATMMIPSQVTMIPMYLLMNQAGLTGTYTGIALLQNMYAQEFGLLMAGATVMIIPVIIVYAIFQKLYLTIAGVLNPTAASKNSTLLF